MSIGTWRKKAPPGNDQVDADGPFSAYATMDCKVQGFSRAAVMELTWGIKL